MILRPGGCCVRIKNHLFLPQFKRNQISESNMGLTHAIYCENFFFPQRFNHIRYIYCYLTTEIEMAKRETLDFFSEALHFGGFFCFKRANKGNMCKSNLLTGKKEVCAKIRNDLLVLASISNGYRIFVVAGRFGGIQNLWSLFWF